VQAVFLFSHTCLVILLSAVIVVVEARACEAELERATAGGWGMDSYSVFLLSPEFNSPGTKIQPEDHEDLSLGTSVSSVKFAA